MQQPRKTLIIIPARAGSKRLPGKNKKLLGQKPLIQWTFDFAKKIKLPSTIVVSTDDEDISALAERNGIEVPFMRPRAIAGDKSPPAEYINHTITEMEKQGLFFLTLFFYSQHLRLEIQN